VRTEGESHAAIAVETRVWARAGATSGAGPNGRVLQGRQAHAVAKGAHAATGAGGINKSSSYFIFANLSSRSTLCPSTPSALCNELWCRRLALKLVEWGLCPLIFVRCLFVVECVQTTMSEGSGRSGGRGPNRGAGRSGGKRPMYEDLDALQSTH
jgi:hypothetical protein